MPIILSAIFYWAPINFSGSQVIILMLAIISSLIVTAFFASMMIYSKTLKCVESGTYNKAIALCEQGSALLGYAGLSWVADIGLLQLKVEALARDGQLVESQIAYAQWTKNKQLEIVSKTTLANMLANAGRFDSAAVLFRERYERSKTSRESTYVQLIVTANMGWITLLTQQLEESKTYSEEALALERKEKLVKSVEMQVNILTNLARANVQLGNLAEAEKQLDEAFEVMGKKRPGSLNQSIGEIQLGFAELRFLQNRFEEALLHTQSANEFFRSVGRGNALRQYSLQLQICILECLGRNEEARAFKSTVEAEELLLSDSNTSLFDKTAAIIDRHMLLT